jgi:hypothetical protein
MTTYTRRRLLREMGIATASLAAIGLSSRRTLARSFAPAPTASSDLYIILQGPWLFSVEDRTYLRAVTVDFPGHSYSYVDTLNGSGPKTIAPICTTNSNCPANAPIAAGPYNFDVTPSSGSPLTYNGALFNSMRSSYQGLFFNAGITLPAMIQEPAREIHLSYPDSVFPMDLLSGINFNNLGNVQNSQVKQWPFAIVLRYTNWTMAKLAHAGRTQQDELINKGTGQTHRVFSIAHPASTESDPCKAAADVISHAQAYFAALMNLLSPPQATPPIPVFPTCTDGHIPVSNTPGGDDNISPCELDPDGSSCASATKSRHRMASDRATGRSPVHVDMFGAPLVNCASGGGGIIGCC